jgi:alpha-tubulin suppressor-like RCC1 family protein
MNDVRLRDMSSHFYGAKIEQIVKGDRHWLALDEYGVAYSWGESNTYGQLGHGDFEAQLIPQTITELQDKKITTIMSGCDYSMCEMDNGDIYVWGSNAKKQLALADKSMINKPHYSQTLSKTFTKIVCGGYHCLGLDANGHIFAWGDNQNGRLGLKLSDDECHAYPILLPFSIKTPCVDISAGTFHSIALSQQGEVFCWGSNKMAALGDPKREDSAAPNFVSGLGDKVITRICTSSCTTNNIAITNTGRVFAWGNNTFGQLSLGKNIGEISQPKEILGFDGNRIENINLGNVCSFFITRQLTWSLPVIENYYHDIDITH